MSEPASATVRRLFAAYAEAGPEGMAELFAPGARFVVSPEVSAEPDTYVGDEGLRRYFAGWEGVIDDLRLEVREVEDVGDDAAIAVVRFSGRGVASGIRAPEQETVLAVRVRHGQVAEMSAHRDVGAARLALERQARPDR